MENWLLWRLQDVDQRWYMTISFWQNSSTDCVRARGESKHCGPEGSLFLHTLLPGICDIKPLWQGTVMSISTGLEGSQTQRQSGACPWCHPCMSGNPLKNVYVLLNLCVCAQGEGGGHGGWLREWIINEVLLNTQTHKPDTPYCITARRRDPFSSIQTTYALSRLHKHAVLMSLRW